MGIIEGNAVNDPRSHNIAHVTQPIRHASGQRWGPTKRFMDASEVVVHEIDCQCRNVVRSFLREFVGQTGDAVHGRPHGEILPLDVTGADVQRVGGSPIVASFLRPEQTAELWRFSPSGELPSTLMRIA
jgi:hypothetical protein